MSYVPVFQCPCHECVVYQQFTQSINQFYVVSNGTRVIFKGSKKACESALKSIPSHLIKVKSIHISNFEGFGAKPVEEHILQQYIQTKLKTNNPYLVPNK